MVFAGGRKGIRLKGLRPEVVELGNGLTADDCLVHDETDPYLAAIVARMDFPEFPVPMGVIHCLPRPTYEVLANEQIAAIQAKSGHGNLQKLLFGNETWKVE
jgi:2-oxoglutarate ferredoxin oxidoreductase subunit beta